VSPILTRPVREQLEHDRVIRELQARHKRKFDVVINPGNEQNQSITVGELTVFPDLLLFAQGTRRLVGTVEVETGESVNAIEARAEWGVFSKLKVPLHLYVPPVCVDAARRICDEYQIVVSELWTHSTTFDQIRFTLVHRSPDAPVVKIPERDREKKVEKKDEKKVEKKVEKKPAAKPVAKPVAKAKPAAKKPAPKPKARPKPAAKKAAPKKAKPAPKKGGKKRR
jgi:hypothetical protein